MLVHPNIVRVHDRGEYRGRLWLSMDYIEGETLGELITRKFPAGMPAQIVIPIVASIADALTTRMGRAWCTATSNPATSW